MLLQFHHIAVAETIEEEKENMDDGKRGCG